MDIRISPSSVVIAPKGDIDIATAPAVLDALTEALTISAAKAVVFDLVDVTFMDSSAAKCVIYAHNRMRARGGHVLVCNGSPQVTRVLRILGLDGEIDITDQPVLVAHPAPAEASLFDAEQAAIDDCFAQW